MHSLFRSVSKADCPGNGCWKLTVMILLMLGIGFTVSTTTLHAQMAPGGSSPLELLQRLSPEQRKTLDNFTPAQRQALKDEVIKSGGKLTSELIDKIKAQAQDMTGRQSTGAVISQETTTQTVTGVQTPQEAAENRAIARKKEMEFELKTANTVTLTDPSTTFQRSVTLQRFGYDFFASSRTRILTLEDALSSGEAPATLPRDALSGFVGPLDMVSTNVNASVPPSYVLNPGDQVTVYYWGDLIELTSVNLVLDERGSVSLPKGGRLVARGMSLPQFQKAVQNHLQRELSKNVKVIATLDKLKSMQILIFGEAFRPGSYAVSAVTTLFNALFAGGGPNENGSLRDIKLVRRNTTVSVDFYNYLMKGDARADYPLQPGDAIFIGRSGKLVSITGEVGRPAVYELRKDENVRALVAMADGIKPTGLSNKVHILSVVPNKQRTVADVDLSAKSPVTDHEIYDGDVVTVDPIISYVENQVTLTGNVKVPGVYELKKHMHVSDLFNGVNEPWGEAYLKRANIFRLDKDRKTTTVIPFNLEKALQKDPANDLELVTQDHIVVYSKWDVKYYPEMLVTISGAVQRPGDYVRTVGMRLKDLLDEAGGVLPGTSNVIAIAKARSRDEIRTLNIQLDLLEKGDESQNVPLDDMDIVMVRADSEFFERPRWVEINGEVKYPGKYPLLRRGYRLSELIEKAGGLTRTADPRGAVFLRRSELLPSSQQKGDLAAVNRIVNALNNSEAQRQATRNLFLLRQMPGVEATGQGPAVGAGTVIATGSSAKEAAALSLAPSIAQATGAATGGVVSAFTTGAAVSSTARALTDEQLTQSTRIVIDMEKAMAGGDTNPANTVLMDGDSITVPVRTETASVVGAVMNPITFHIADRRKVKEIVSLAGGYTADADQERGLVLRLDGTIVLAEDAGYVEEGDILYVPTKVVATEILTTADKVINVIKYTLTTAAGVIIFLALIP
jgi:protein involved in polysaccharide export with SLBB domain